MDYTAEQAQKLKVIYGDVTLGVSGEDFHYIFSYQTGGMESLCIRGREWLYRTPRPAFWRALTDNDRGSSFHLKSGMWLGADLFIKCTDIQVSVDGCPIPLPKAPENNRYGNEEYAESITVSFLYDTITVPRTTVKITYEVRSSGKILVTAEYKGQKGLPELPVFGMRFLIPSLAAGYRYEGLSGETYPDRKAGGVRGIYHTEGLPVTPYIVPQDCGMHMDTGWVEIYRENRQNDPGKNEETPCLKITAVRQDFAFNCLPYTAEELENAFHIEELPPARRTVLGIYGAVRGVGGIDSWGADVEEGYRVSGEEDICFSFQISFS